MIAAIAGVVIGGTAIGDPAVLCAQEQATRSPRGQRLQAAASRSLGSIDGDTRWALRAVSPVFVSSPIVRLGDVVQPLDPDMVGWERLRRSPIALVPMGTQPMTIQRARLEQAILNAEATPLAIEWYGPTEIHIAYRPPAPNATVSADVSNSEPSMVTTAAYPQTVPPQSVRTTESPLSQSEAERFTHWIRLALDRLDPKLSQAYRIEIRFPQPDMVSPASITGVTEVTPIDRITAGDCRFQLLARTIDGPVETEVRVHLDPHPRVVMLRRAVARGHIISSEDVELQQLPAEELASEHVLDPAELVGLEVRGFPRPGKPLSRLDFGAPTLIRRGDLIEVRVLGEGVTVTANAKAHGDGAASDLIEVETLEPRKRLLARVVEPGLVEIVTRAPRARP